MSHELRTPVNAILGFAPLLNIVQLSPKQQGSVQQILKGGKHLLNLINEVLDITRIEAGKLSVAMEEINLTEVLGEVIQLVSAIASENQVTLNFENQKENNLYVLADKQRLIRLWLTC